jgi:regulator of replication initiation timing
VRERFLREQWENELAGREAQRQVEVENLQQEVARLQAQNRDVLEDNRALREEQERLKGRMLEGQRNAAKWRKEAVYVFLTLTYYFLN